MRFPQLQLGQSLPWTMMKGPSLLLHDIFWLVGRSVYGLARLFRFSSRSKGGMENVRLVRLWACGFINNNSINIYLRLRASPSYPQANTQRVKNSLIN